MDSNKILNIMLGIVVTILVIIYAFFLIKVCIESSEEKEKQEQYYKECEQKAILYDYIMKNKVVE